MAESKQPNILLIHSDQHNPFATGCYGDPLVQTPHLDALAAKGVVFDACYCTSPICVPSRMSNLSCRHPYENEVWTNQHSLDSSIPTIAHAMGAVGYEPILIGRMHALGLDQLHGYARRLVGDHGPNYPGGGGVDRGVLNGTAGPQRISLQNSGPGQSAYQVHDEDVTAATVHVLNQLGVQKRAGLMDKPFSISVGLMLPHPPYVARKQDYEVVRQQMTLPSIPCPEPADEHPFLKAWREHTGIESVTEEEILRSRASYWALISRMDAMIGQILSALHENDLAGNTLIMYTSDHGDMQGDHGLWWKHVFYEASARVPLILSWPGMIPNGQRCGRVVSALDASAALVDAAGSEPLPATSGRSLLPLVMGDGGAEWEDVAFSEYCSDEFCPSGVCYQRMIRSGDWKLIYYHDWESQLFNLAEDPDELVNRASDPACHDVVERLTARLKEGWEPDVIGRKMAEKRAQIQVLRDWARSTHPADTYRWTMKPEMNFLDARR
ncbi:MAG: sulfatase-like hydrolase/transferase [Anaerolineae bacterium]|nr:sulfatase-like hydrolase/transferase [Anaerolineae bacterium]